MSLPRLRLRTLMVAVVVVAVALALGRLASHQAQCKAKAALNAYLEEQHTRNVLQFAADAPALAEKYRRKAARCRLLRAKYEQAARRPWLPVPPDPPEPE